MMRTETINDPAQVALRPRMMSVNTARQVDLLAQANGSRPSLTGSGTVSREVRATPAWFPEWAPSDRPG
jgi:Acetyl-CoA hydrolase/transferase C-terminal domain